jgi:hypothetical protein
MTSITDDPESLLTRDQAAITLKAAGFPVSKATLSTMASRGHGPIYRRFGPRVLYRRADLMDWAKRRLSGPRSSTSEADVLPAPSTSESDAPSAQRRRHGRMVTSRATP